jgi:hypothetical protein
MQALRPIYATLAVSALCAIPLTASAAKTFAGPASWNHVVVGTPGAPRTVDVWKQNSSPSTPVLNVVVDTTASYADALSQVRANGQNGGIHITADKDRPCGGVTAHEFDIELDAGTKILSTYTIVPDPKGLTRITYSRPADAPAGTNKEVQAAVDAFCSG